MTRRAISILLAIVIACQAAGSGLAICIHGCHETAEGQACAQPEQSACCGDCSQFHEGRGPHDTHDHHSHGMHTHVVPSDAMHDDEDSDCTDIAFEAVEAIGSKRINVEAADLVIDSLDIDMAGAPTVRITAPVYTRAIYEYTPRAQAPPGMRHVCTTRLLL